MRRHLAGALTTIGTLMILVGLGALIPPAPAAAQVPVPQPSPRPPVDFSAETADRPTPAPSLGLITGTVIDQTTGTPAGGVAVRVGDMTLTTDASGNYGEWVLPGTYSVQLVVGEGSVAVVQEPQAVSVQAGERTVQHLSFRSPAPVNVAAAVEEQQVVSPAPPVLDTPPRVLPRTGLSLDQGVVWAGVGLLLLLAGLAVWNKPLLRPAPAAARPGSDDELLAALLRGDERQ